MNTNTTKESYETNFIAYITCVLTYNALIAVSLFGTFYVKQLQLGKFFEILTFCLIFGLGSGVFIWIVSIVISRNEEHQEIQ